MQPKGKVLSYPRLLDPVTLVHSLGSVGTWGHPKRTGAVLAAVGEADEIDAWRSMSEGQNEGSSTCETAKHLPLLLSAPAWLVLLKVAHSYFVLLAVLTGTSIWMAFGLWAFGSVGFGLGSLAVFAWFAPAILPEEGTGRLQLASALNPRQQME